ncbi:MAG: c-type cytochrome [Hyphomicrobiales bacterium]|nr:c-type cytochrome [Hyphomicrobiales bacterium]MBV8827123.1 c-type cytochrome [Hyphomicrobiales bacterium]MBV9426724.1 c-type cytochrome [Bradyrhizobiaceae bacterium]
MNAREHVPRLRRAAAALILACVALALAACDPPEDRYTTAQAPSGGNPSHGASLIRQYGCGECHIVPGIAGAEGLVGPPLNKLARRVYIAGVMRNSPDNLMAWLQDPQAVVPGNAMPRMGLNRDQARDITAYLYTLR